LLELKLIYPVSNYLNDNFIKIDKPITNIFSGKIILIIFLLILLCLITIILIQLLIKILNIIFVKIFKRSLDQNLFFYYSKLYSNKSKKDDPLHILIRLKSGNYLLGVPKKFSDFDDNKHIYLISVVELDSSFNLINSFTDLKDRTEDGILIDLNNCEFICYNVKDEMIKNGSTLQNESGNNISNIVKTILSDRKIISSFNLSKIKEEDEMISLNLERKEKK